MSIERETEKHPKNKLANLLTRGDRAYFRPRNNAGITRITSSSTQIRDTECVCNKAYTVPRKNASTDGGQPVVTPFSLSNWVTCKYSCITPTIHPLALKKLQSISTSLARSPNSCAYGCYEFSARTTVSRSQTCRLSSAYYF